MKLEIRKLGHSEKPPMDLLLKADPSEEMIEKYLYAGECYLAEAEGELVGVFVLMPNTAHEVEIKNISVEGKVSASRCWEGYHQVCGANR